MSLVDCASGGVIAPPLLALEGGNVDKRGDYSVQRIEVGVGVELCNEQNRCRIEYVFHCDPGTSGSNFALAIGHVELIDTRRHSVVDLYDLWRPAEFPLGRVDYNVVFEKLLGYARWFRPTRIYHDNHNTAFFSDRLQPALKENFLAATVHLRSHTQTEKFRRYEDFKTRTNLGEVHAPAHPLAVMEARFIEQNGLEIRHPTSGPCQTDDLIDATSWMVWHLANSAGNLADQFGGLCASVNRANELFDRFYSDRFVVRADGRIVLRYAARSQEALRGGQRWTNWTNDDAFREIRKAFRTSAWQGSLPGTTRFSTAPKRSGTGRKRGRKPLKFSRRNLARKRIGSDSRDRWPDEGGLTVESHTETRRNPSSWPLGARAYSHAVACDP